MNKFYVLKDNFFGNWNNCSLIYRMHLAFLRLLIELLPSIIMLLNIILACAEIYKF